jgi:hypothetical protein
MLRQGVNTQRFFITIFTLKAIGASVEVLALVLCFFEIVGGVMELGYFFCGDLLGFSNIVKNLNSHDLEARVAEWVALVEVTAKNHAIEKIQLISDTVFAAVGKDKNDLKKLINFARDLLNHGILKSFPIRGAISYGNFNWDGSLVYGSPVIKAHALEQRQKWIGIILDVPALAEREYVDMGLVCYPVPMEPGSHIVIHAVVAWSIPKFEELLIILMSGGLSIKGERLTWGWGDKFQNTILFGLYIEILKKAKASPASFGWASPLHPIYMALAQ